MNNNFDINKLSREIIKSSNGKITSADIEKLKRGDMSALFGALSESDRKNLKNALNNKAVKDEILKSRQAQSIINNIKKGNG